MARPGRGQVIPPIIIDAAPLKAGPTEVPLCTPTDVARILGVNPVPAAPWAEADIESASSWARKFLRRPDLGKVGEVVEKFYHVEVDGYLTTEGVPVSVSVIAITGEPSIALEANNWEYDGEGIRLFPSPRIWLVDDDQFEAPWVVERDWYVRVDVVTQLPEAVDPIIRDGVAVAAAAILTRSPRLAKGLNSERIGDYSYSLTRVETSDQWFEQAKSLLRTQRRVFDLVP